MKIPKVGSDVGSGHHIYLEYPHNPLKLLTFSSTWIQAVVKVVDISHPQYTYTKRGVFYFSKSVPTDLRHHYLKPRIVQSLKTKSQPQRASLLSPTLFYDQILQRHIRVHALEFGIFLFKLFQSLVL